VPAVAFASYHVIVDGRAVPARVRAAVVAGHAYLPLRALGSALGGSVVYDPRTHDVVVRRAARRSIVPSHELRIVDGRAYAPLRALAAAFGMMVAYDARTRTVALNDRAPTIVTAPAPTKALALEPLSPPDGARIHDAYPTIAARLDGATTIDPGRLSVVVDGRDVRADASVVGNVVTYTPRTALTQGTHTVAIANGESSVRWTFTDDFAFASEPPATPSPITGFYVDRIVAPGTSAFDVVVRGEPGLIGAVAVDGVNQRFPLVVAGANLYVAHVVVPPGVVQPFAHVAARISLPDGTTRLLVMPQTLTIVTPTPAPKQTTRPIPPPDRKRRPLSHPSPMPSGASP
jgi:hypothetical protein